MSIDRTIKTVYIYIRSRRPPAMTVKNKIPENLYEGEKKMTITTCTRINVIYRRNLERARGLVRNFFTRISNKFVVRAV